MSLMWVAPGVGTLVLALKMAALLALFCGWGAVTAWRGSARQSTSVFESCFRGMAAAMLLGLAGVLLLLPMEAVRGVFVAVGVLGLAARCIQAPRFGLPRWEVCALLALLALVIAEGTSRTPLNYDLGLYQLQAMELLGSGEWPLGMANLHYRLGFNSTGQVFSVLVGGFPFGLDGPFIVNAVAVLALLGYLLERALEGAVFHAVAAVAVLLSLDVTLFSWFGLSPTPEMLAAVLTVMCFALALDGWESTDDHRMGTLLMLAALAVTVKLSQGYLLLLAAVLAWRLWKAKARGWAAEAAVAMVLLVGWMGMGVMTSGCLFFPAEASCVWPLPWAPRAGEPLRVANEIRDWARAPGVAQEQIPPGLGWLGLWVEKMLPHRQFVPRLGWIFVGLLVLLAALRGQVDRSRAAGTLFAIGGLGVLYWFVTAPDPRFVLGLMIAVPALAASMVSGRLKASAVIAFAVLSSMAEFAMVKRVEVPGGNFAWRAIGSAQTVEKVSAGGFRMLVPVGDDKCWKQPAPCTPAPDGALREVRIGGRTAWVKDPALGRGAVSLIVTGDESRD